MNFNERLAQNLSEQQFLRYRHASLAHANAGIVRTALGTTSANPGVEHLAAVDQAEAALLATSRELESARDAYLGQSDTSWH